MFSTCGIFPHLDQISLVVVYFPATNMTLSFHPNEIVSLNGTARVDGTAARLHFSYPILDSEQQQQHAWRVIFVDSDCHFWIQKNQ